jgi:hypothetical protein
VRGWGLHYKEAHVRRRFHQLDDWIVRRLWSHRFKLALPRLEGLADGQDVR